MFISKIYFTNNYLLSMSSMNAKIPKQRILGVNCALCRTFSKIYLSCLVSESVKENLIPFEFQRKKILRKGYSVFKLLYI